MERKNIRFTLDLLNAPESTIQWAQIMLDEIQQSLEDVPDCDAVVVKIELEAEDDN